MRLSDQQKIDIVNEYISGESSVKLAKKYNISKQGILKILKFRKVVIRGKLGK